MRVELPRSFKGSEILDAFKKAANVERPGIDKWIPEDVQGKTEYDIPLLKSVYNKGVRVMRQVLRISRKYIFWGEMRKMWFGDMSYVINLKMIREDLDYNAVNIDIEVNHYSSYTDFIATFRMIVAKMIEILKGKKELNNESVRLDELKTKKQPPPMMVLPVRGANQDAYGD